MCVCSSCNMLWLCFIIYWRCSSFLSISFLPQVKEVLPESAEYSQLLEFEKRLDAALMRKRMDVQDFVMRKPTKTKR